MAKIICINRKWVIGGGFFILLVVWYILYNSLLYPLFHKPLLTITIRFRETPPIGQALMREGIGLFYRGFEVGEVYKVELSDDQNYIVFRAHIYYPNLKLPKNVKALLRTQGVLGDKFISLVIPSKPSPEPLPNGAVLDGTTLIEDLGELLVNELGKSNAKKLMISMTELAHGLAIVVNENRGQIRQLLKEFAKSGGNANEVLDNFKEIIENPELKSDIKSTVHYSSKSTKKINDILESKEIQEVITSTPETLNEANKTIKSIDEHISKATENIPETTKTFNEAAKTYNCLGQGISDMLSKRFLVFKLLFGAPGNSLEKCKKCK